MAVVRYHPSLYPADLFLDHLQKTDVTTALGDDRDVGDPGPVRQPEALAGPSLDPLDDPAGHSALAAGVGIHQAQVTDPVADQRPGQVVQGGADDLGAHQPALASHRQQLEDAVVQILVQVPTTPLGDGSAGLGLGVLVPDAGSEDPLQGRPVPGPQDLGGGNTACSLLVKRNPWRSIQSAIRKTGAGYPSM